MNKKDAIKLMLEGKKVRQKEWIDRAYLYMNESGEILNCDNSLDNLNFYSDEYWEEHVEGNRKELPVQMKHLKDWYKLLRVDSWVIPCVGLDCVSCPLHKIKSGRCIQEELRIALKEINKEWKLDK